MSVTKGVKETELRGRGTVRHGAVGAARPVPATEVGRGSLSWAELSGAVAGGGIFIQCQPDITDI